MNSSLAPASNTTTSVPDGMTVPVTASATTLQSTAPLAATTTGEKLSPAAILHIPVGPTLPGSFNYVCI